VSDLPLVSICIPTFNGARFLRDTIKSVLNQTYENLEIRISDHSSSDNTQKIVNSFHDSRIVFHTQESGGGAEANWNASIAGARGKYIKLLCQDDILKPDCISEQVETLENNPECSFCFSSRDVISPRGITLLPSRGFKPKKLQISLTEFLPTLVRSGTNIFGEPCSVLMNTSALKQVGPFSGSYLIDLNMWYSLWKVAPAIYAPITAAKFRISKDSWTTALTGQQARQFESKLNEILIEWPLLIDQNDVDEGIRQAQKLERNRIRLMKIVEFLHI
jgi:glycosyltransferase involved in cell wall biosynthesis